LRRDSLGYGRRQTSYNPSNGDVKGISDGLRRPLPLKDIEWSISAHELRFCVTPHRLTRSSSVFIRSASHIASRHSSSSSMSAQNCGMFWWTHSIKVAVSTGAVLSKSCSDGVRTHNDKIGWNVHAAHLEIVLVSRPRMST
jgi:hypothetical protein